MCWIGYARLDYERDCGSAWNGGGAVRTGGKVYTRSWKAPEGLGVR